MDLDLAMFASIGQASDRLIQAGKPLDLIIGNAGVMATPFGETVDGFETQLGTNALGHFLLINRLASLLRHEGRVVLVSSSGHRIADVDLQDPNFKQSAYDPWVAYGRSKTAVSLIAVAFDRRHSVHGVRACSFHPGGIRTGLGRNLTPGALDEMVAEVNHKRKAAGEPEHTWKTIPQGAATSVWAGVVADAVVIGGRYCENCHVSPVLPDDAVGTDGEGVKRYALDPEHAEAVWRQAEKMVGESFPPHL